MTDVAALIAEANKHQERLTGIGAGNCVLCRAKWPCETVGLTGAVRDLTEEVQRHQLGDSYQVGYEHGRAAGIKAARAASGDTPT